MEEAYRQPGHSAAFSGRTQLSRQFPASNATQFLSSVDSYTRHRQGKKPRYRNPIYVYNRREILQIDLADVRSLAEHNDNTKYLLLAIDSFSRRAWIRILVSKKAPIVVLAMESILNEMGIPSPKRVLSDSGSEFIAAQMKRLFRAFNISHSTSTAEVKAPTVERFCQTLKRLMHMYMTENETFRYLDQLDNLLATYNSRFHRSINMSPNEADKPENRDKVIDVLNRKRYGPIAQRRNKNKDAFQVGDYVRLKVDPSKFQKGHEETFTGEIFRIKTVNDTLPITQYTVETWNGTEEIKGAFYASELQLCSNALYKCNVLSKRRRNGKLQYFVRWLHFGPEYDEWINQSDIEQEFENE